MFRLMTLACLLTVLTPAPAAADEVRLQNGDRYTGSVVALTAGALTFKTAGGTLAVPWAQVVALTIDQPLLVRVGSNAPVTATLVTTGTDVTLQPGGAVRLGDIVALTLPQPSLTVVGGANAGFVTTSGNTEVNSLRLDGEVVARAAANRFTAGGALNRAEDRGAETAESWTGAAKYDRFLTTRMFVNANGIVTHDKFRDLDLRSAVGVGLGYQVINTPLVRLTADAGVGYVNENLATAPDDSYTAARESARLDLFVGGRRAQLFHNHDGYFGLTGEDNLFFRTQNGVRVGIAAGFVTTLQLDLDYDRSPSPGRKNTDRTFALTVGYRF
jgi:putative salt-induced outer membrane protein YdiY